MNISIPEKLKVSLEEKRLIFTINAGRSGTGYLAKLLHIVPNVVGYHEPEPDFVDVMRPVQQDASIAYKFWINRKLPQILNEQVPMYIETSHLFCKGFVEPLLKLGITPDLIILTRPHRKAVTSLYQLGKIPGRTEKGLRYFLSPEDQGVLLLPGWQALDDYQLCYWYCLEIERRCKEYKKMFLKKNTCVVEVSLNELKTIRDFNKLIKKLNLPNIGVSS